MSLYDELMAERFGPPVRTDRPLPALHANLGAAADEIYRTPMPLRALLPEDCCYAGCARPGVEYRDGWALCPSHLLKHRSEVAS